MKKPRIAFDTSVLVAGLVESHPQFTFAAPWLDALHSGKIMGFWTTHAYAETWAVLTRMPLLERPSLEAVVSLVDQLAATCPPTPLAFDDYQSAASRSAVAGLRSGVIFDALHLVSAERAKAEVLLTFNGKDFLRLSPTIRILAPRSDLEWRA